MLEDIEQEKLNEVKIFYFGFVMVLLLDLFCLVYLWFMLIVKDNGQFVLFDFNYCEDLWKGRVLEFVSIVKKVIVVSDFVKVSDEEFEIISGVKNYEKGVVIFYEIGVNIVVVIFGKSGMFFFNGKDYEIILSILVILIDLIGVGDVFVGVVLY